MADRQQRIETNRSLRLIKNELESLLEKGVITDEAFDSIHSILPSEASLSGSTPVPSAARNNTTAPTASLANLNLNPTDNTSTATTNSSSHPAVPSYAQSTGNSNAPTHLSGHNAPPPPAPAQKPILSHARALYRYNAADSRDCSFERDDRIAIYEYMNADWWMGRNERTGQEGIFPRTYVELDMQHPSGGPYSGNEKAGGAYGGYPGQQQQQNPYNSSVPPMAVAEQPANSGGAGAGGKGGEMGKKFGKKLGNAAIFGAGATIGGNIVNSIF